MLQTKGGKKARVFTIELKSRDSVRHVALSNGSQGVLIEGTLGGLKRAEFVDGVVLEVAGEYGVLGVDLARDDLAKHEQKNEGDGAN